MTMIYDVVAKRHNTETKPDVVLFYDEDREVAISAMRKYCRENGFTITEGKNRFTIANLVIRERESTGKTVSETQYADIFDIYDRRKDK